MHLILMFFLSHLNSPNLAGYHTCNFNLIYVDILQVEGEEEDVEGGVDDEDEDEDGDDEEGDEGEDEEEDGVSTQ